mgnify:CR=1 FL=1
MGIIFAYLGSCLGFKKNRKTAAIVNSVTDYMRIESNEYCIKCSEIGSECERTCKQCINKFKNEYKQH